MTRRYQAHGLLVDSDVELPPFHRRSRRRGLPPDLVLRRVPDRPVPATDPAGEPLARLADPAGRTFFSMATGPTGTMLRYPGLCEFVGDAPLREVTSRWPPTMPLG